MISNDGWEHTDSDIWAIHDYAPTGRRAAPSGTAAPRPSTAALQATGTTGRTACCSATRCARGQPVMLTEFGGLSFAPGRAARSGSATPRSADADDLLARFAGLVGAVLDSPQIAGFCYTQLADTEQETNGLLTAARQPKVDPARLRAVIARPSRGIGAEQVDAERADAEHPDSTVDPGIDLHRAAAPVTAAAGNGTSR